MILRFIVEVDADLSNLTRAEVVAELEGEIQDAVEQIPEVFSAEVTEQK